MIARELEQDVDQVPWYHSIELPGGIVTPGEYDIRSSVPRLPMPPSLAGKRCLDVGTHDGFWAFEMERRGASSVVAVDLDDPSQLDWPGPPREIDEKTLQWLAQRRMAFKIAHSALRSNVERRDLSVYDLTPDMVGEFDFAFLGTLLHHLRDPVGALMAVRRVVKGPFVVCAVFSVSKTLVHPRRPVTEMLAESVPFWEVPNLAGLRRQFKAGGWTVDQITRPFFQQYGKGWVRPAIDLKAQAWSLLPRRLLLHFGALHVGVLARPTTS